MLLLLLPCIGLGEHRLCSRARASGGDGPLEHVTGTAPPINARRACPCKMTPPVRYPPCSCMHGPSAWHAAAAFLCSGRRRYDIDLRDDRELALERLKRVCQSGFFSVTDFKCVRARLRGHTE